ncbi:Protein trichome birefringence-like 25 [Linum grandiflorum]
MGKPKDMMMKNNKPILPPESNTFTFFRNHHFFLKFLASFLLIALTCRLFSSDSFLLSSSSSFATSFEEDSDSISLSESSTNTNQEKCDLFAGEWVRDPSGPFYTNRSCHEIQDHQNCMRNGRPDSEYLYWRWRPNGCDLRKFNPRKFLKLMRNKSMAFIGDSISRNHVQSLLCILSQVEDGVEVYRDKNDKCKRWLFQSHNFTLSVIWSPFLIKSEIFEDNNGISSKEIQLHLDQLDPKWTEQYSSFDYAVIAAGKWFLKTAVYHENNKVAGCHYCPTMNLTELGHDYAYRRAISLALEFAAKQKAMLFLRTTTPDHFENGEWFSGGTCNRTVPFKEGEIDLGDLDGQMRDIELEEFKKVATESGNLKLLDTTRLSMLRPDGHPGPYMHSHPFEKKDEKVQNDCLHWCLPGPIDSWNDLVMQMIVNGYR